MSERHIGVVYRLCSGRNFGFVKMDRSDEQVFVHRTETGWFFDQLKIGDTVEFALMADPRGLRATDVHLIEQAADARVSGTVVTINDRYAFAAISNQTAFFAAADYEGNFDALVKGQTISARLVRQPGRSNPRAVEVRPDF
jgi:cold shock CspA family protein